LSLHLEASSVGSAVGGVDAPVVLDHLGLELLPVLGKVGGLLCGLLAAGLLNRGAGSGGDGAAGGSSAGAAGRVEGGVCGVHLVVVLFDGGPQLVGVGLAPGGLGHAGDDGVVAGCGGRHCDDLV
jgi:hypothetical protein